MLLSIYPHCLFLMTQNVNFASEHDIFTNGKYKVT